MKQIRFEQTSDPYLVLFCYGMDTGSVLVSTVYYSVSFSTDRSDIIQDRCRSQETRMILFHQSVVMALSPTLEKKETLQIIKMKPKKGNPSKHMVG